MASPRRRKLSKITAWGLLACVLVSVPAQAQSAADRTTARALAQEGQAAFEAGNFERAADRFRRADALVHAPTLMLALARSQTKLGQLVQAHETYARIIREGVPSQASKVFRRAVEDAKAEIRPLAARLSWVTVEIHGAEDGAVSIDGKEIPTAAIGVRRAVNPGEHVARAEAEGFLPTEEAFTVAEGEETRLSLTLQPRPASSEAPAADEPAVEVVPAADTAEESSPMGRTFGFVALGVGGAGLIAGGITGILAMGRNSDLEKACPGGQCPESSRGDLDSYRKLGTISTVGFIVGGVGAAAGVTLLLTSRNAEPNAGSVGIRIGLDGVMAKGRF